MTRTLTLTNRPPVTIDEDHWPIIASGDWHDDPHGHRSQANRDASVRVRHHADGRTLVYGYARSMWRGERDLAGGRLLPSTPTESEVIAAIHAVADQIGHPDLADDCIADLPAEELS